MRLLLVAVVVVLGVMSTPNASAEDCVTTNLEDPNPSAGVEPRNCYEDVRATVEYVVDAGCDTTKACVPEQS